VQQLWQVAGAAAFAAQQRARRPARRALHNRGQPARSCRVSGLHPGFGQARVAAQRGIKRLPRQRADLAVQHGLCRSLLYRVAQVGEDLVAALQQRAVGMPQRQLA